MSAMSKIRRILQVPAVACALFFAALAAAQTTGRPESGKRLDDETLMQPTKLGLRLTPEIARGAARIWVGDELRRRLDLDDRQSERMADLISRRVMETGHRSAEQLQAFAECFLESAIGVGPGGHRWSPEVGQRFADRVEPLIPELRKFFDGLLDDSRPVLDERQMAKFQDQMDKAKGGLDSFEERMGRWRKGEMKEGEHPFSGPRENPNESDSQDPEKVRREQRERTLRRAERQLDRTLADHGPTAWEQIFNGARDFFKFNEEQVAEGQHVLDDYRERYRELMTDELKERIRRNRMMYSFQSEFRDQPYGPWFYHLQRDFDEMIQPVSDMGKECIDAIMALVTPEQRRAAMETVQNAVAEHGLPPDEIDAEALGMGGR